MAVPATSVRAEQVWSHAGAIHSKKRTSMAMGTLKNLLFAQQNISHLDVEGLTPEDFIR